MLLFSSVFEATVSTAVLVLKYLLAA